MNDDKKLARADTAKTAWGYLKKERENEKGYLKNAGAQFSGSLLLSVAAMRFSRLWRINF
ncbi:MULTISPECIES: hypothetical protein [Eikenella]|nr:MULTISPECIES: hypothetical protein [Eikenella]